MYKPTFKQYLESKQQLLKAVEEYPRVVTEYSVVKYCSLVVEDENGDSVTASLKPKQTLIVEWICDDPINPQVASVMIDGCREVDPEHKFSTTWSRQKTHKWLNTNTKEVR